MKIIKFIISSILLGYSIICFSQENPDFKPSGHPTFRIFSNFHSTITDGETHHQFELKRAYLGYKHNFSENWSGAVIFDVGNPKDDGQHQMSAFVKNAQLRYQKDAWTVNFGLIGTTSFHIQQQHWGYRYMLKSFQNEYKFGSSADLGISSAYRFNDALSADFIIVNGEGYKKLEQDSIFSVGTGLTAKPIDGLTLRVYYETTTRQKGAIKRQNTTALFAGYKISHLSVGAEYNQQSNNGMIDGKDWNGFSTYVTLLIKSTKILARYDLLKSKHDWNTNTDGSLLVLGTEFNPVKGVKITPNLRHVTPSADDTKDISYVYVNCEIKF